MVIYKNNSNIQGFYSENQCQVGNKILQYAQIFVCNFGPVKSIIFYTVDAIIS